MDSESQSETHMMQLGRNGGSAVGTAAGAAPEGTLAMALVVTCLVKWKGCVGWGKEKDWV